MLNIGWSELLLVVVVALLVVGPKDLPKLMRTFGKCVSKLKNAVADFEIKLSESLAEGDLENIRGSIESVGRSSGSIDLRAPIYKPWTRSKPPVSVGTGETKDARKDGPTLAVSAPLLKTKQVEVSEGYNHAKAHAAKLRELRSKRTSSTLGMAIGELPKTEPANAQAAGKTSTSAKRKAAAKAKSSKPKPAPAKPAKTASAKRRTTKAKSKT